MLYSASLPELRLFQKARRKAEKTLKKKDVAPPKLKSHKLVELGAAAGIHLTAREKWVLEWLAEVVIWKARYSVPTGMSSQAAFSTNSTTSRSTAGVNVDRSSRTFSSVPRKSYRAAYDAGRSTCL